MSSSALMTPGTLQPYASRVRKLIEFGCSSVSYALAALLNLLSRPSLLLGLTRSLLATLSRKTNGPVVIR